MFSAFLIGIDSFFQGFTVFSQKGLRRYAYIPIIINILIFSLFFYFGFDYVYHKLDENVNVFFKIVLLVFFTIAILLVIGLTASVVANLIASPFNSMLAEKTDRQLSDFKSPPMNLITLSVKAISREFHKLWYYLPRAILVGILFIIIYFIPVINIFAPIIFYLFGAWMLAFQYLDYAADNRQIPIKAFKIILKKHRGASLGFGFMCMLFMSIPLINLVILPVCVVGAVILWHRLS